MKDDRTVGALLNASYAYSIPPYQRDYEWTPDKWQALVSDVMQAATAPKKHWLGVMLLSADPARKLPGDEDVDRFTVIDGQQRLVTLVVWLAAIAHHAEDHDLPIPLRVDKLAHISVQASDRAQYRVALENEWREPKHWPLLGHKTGPLAAYVYFRWMLWLGQDALLGDQHFRVPRMRELQPGEKIEAQWEKYRASSKGALLPPHSPIDPALLAFGTKDRLVLTPLGHDPEKDESAAAIFDTLNGKRTELEPLDHVRNSLFIRLTPESRAETVHREYWTAPESVLLDSRLRAMGPGKLFLYDYLIACGEKARQKHLNANRSATHFAVMTKDLKDSDKLERYLREDFLPAMASWPVVVRKRNDLVIEGSPHSFDDSTLHLMTSIRELSANPANPIVLFFLRAYVLGQINKRDLEAALFATEGFLARWLLAREPLSPLRSRVMDLMGKLDRRVSFHAFLDVLRPAWIHDKTVLAATQDIRGARARKPRKPLKSRQVGALLRGIERKLSGSGSMFFTLGKEPHEYGIEHIYPQSPERKWEADLRKWGASPTKMAALTHALGNLTVVTNQHNSSVGDNCLADKKAHSGELGRTALMRINKGWLEAARWTEAEINDRTTELVRSALAYWVLP